MKEWNKILVVAATYIGTIVGAGFATGKEIVVFFSIHGALGTIGIMISGFLFIVVGSKIMIISARIQAYSYQELNEYLFGNKFGKVINFLVFLVVICVTAVMLSGAGALFYEQFSFSNQFGIIITLILCYLVVLKGLKGIFMINSYLVPCLILFSIFIAGMVFKQYPLNFLEVIMPNRLPNGSSWLISPFTYTAFNLMAAQVVLVPLGTEIRDARILKWGGFWGGIGLCLLLLLSHFSLSISPEIFTQEIPMASITKNFGGLFHVFFLFVIYGEIFNTVVGNVYGITRQLKSMFNLSMHQAMLIILFIIFFMSQIGYGKLLSVLYPLFGYIGLLFLSFLLLKKDVID